MKSKLTKIIPAILVGLLGVNALSAPSVYADDSICSNGSVPAEVKAASGCPDSGTAGKLPEVVVNILNAVIGVAGFVAVVFIIIGGIHYMTSSGDPGKTKKARDTILYAAIGLVICALAFAIVNFAIGTVNKAASGGSSSGGTSSGNSGTTRQTEKNIAFFKK